ncbi:short-chain dehydrogenase [Clostridium sp. chh4-2]|uniref:SDR family NAD(P)-dependent oxidoreductase n=1 Tax=Clostridium sp. chh4-2 TaxID=2067550 RepID=UPI000CCDD648|nr:SDR family NAD(P)-dependent oxidoreductase [Clostridium sp. chh4-2]PNV62986.1 short-chain dehydrogenase [Clostridium sp. chh4-2]
MSKKQIAIVTGASKGLGREFVKLLVKENDIMEIWAVSRNRDKLQQLSNEFGNKIRIIPMDLSNRNCFKELETLLKNETAVIKYLINNAGFAKFCSYDDIAIEESLNMIDLNISAVVALGLICIPYMEKGSHIINIASQASFFPLPYQNIYSSTKAFVRNYTRALNVELQEKQIIATAVCPGWMKTELFDRGIVGAKKGTNKFSGIVTPDVVAKKAMDDARKGKDISVYGLYVKFTHLLSKLTPQKIMMKIWLIQQGIG